MKLNIITFSTDFDPSRRADSEKYKHDLSTMFMSKVMYKTYK